MEQPINIDLNQLVRTSCPVCRNDFAVKFLTGSSQPLATLGWPSSRTEAQNMKRFALEYVQCLDCKHVWNHSFSYDSIPYESNPNRMYNKGSSWKGHLEESRDLILSKLPVEPVVVDVGCGEGHFVRGIAEKHSGSGRFMGFDPNTSAESGLGIEFYANLFDPVSDTIKYRPDVIIIRHVIEHLLEPAQMLRSLGWAAEMLDKEIFLFVEVPCIDRVFQTQRISDFFYEHPSQFSTDSFERLMKQAGNILKIGHGYDGEVIFALVNLAVSEHEKETFGRGVSFSRNSFTNRQAISKQIDQLVKQGKSLAVWGGTGKAAAFINYYGATQDKIRLVVDSDLEKVGTFVPGAGQEIRFRDALKSTQVDVLIIPPQWRVRDIIHEMESENIFVGKIMIEHQGLLIDFLNDPHPY